MSSTVDQHQSEISRTGAEIVSLIDELAAAGAVWVRVEWHGSGDEGAIDDVTLMATPPSADNPLVLNLPDLEQKVYDAVSDHLEARYGSWYDGDGGTGSLEIDVPTRDVRIEHGWYEEALTWEYLSDPTALEPTDRDLETTLTAAAQEARDAIAKANRLEAAVTGTHLLRWADEYGGAITGFSYEVDWSTDDEGGFFSTATVTAKSDDDKLTDEVIELLGYPDDDMRAYEYGVDALAVLFDEREDTVMTLDEIRAAVEKNRRG